MNREDHVLDLVDSYLHGALDPFNAQNVAAHIEACPICKVALDEARKRSELMLSLPHVEASEQLIQSTERQLEAYRKRSLPKRARDWFTDRPVIQKVWMAAAVVMLLLGFTHSYITTRSPSPFDLRVLGQTELLAETDASLRVLLVRDSQRAVPNVPVTVELHGIANHPHVRLASFTTDANGTGNPRVQLPDWPSGNYTLRVVAQTSGGAQEISQQVKLDRSWKLMLSTDKPVYQPGQTIHVRSLALRRPDLKPIAGNDVQFTISDPKGNRIFQHRDVTSKFGIASIDCPLATEILEGTYKVDCTVGNVTSTRSVEVKKYTLPKFKVDLTLDAPYYKPGDTVRGSVQAGYFFGKPVANGNVVVELQTVDVGPSPASTARSEVRTDAAGKAEFSLRVPDKLVGREQNSGNARVVVTATVTDSANQDETKSVSRIVTANPIHVDVIPESGRLVKDVVNIVYLIATYADGQPAKARIAISGIDHEISTDALGVATVELTPDATAVRWNVRATDEQGLSGRKNVALEIDQGANDFLVRPDRSVCTAGETLSLTALGSGVEPIFVDLIKDGQTVLTDSIAMSEGAGSYKVDIPADLFGTIDLCTYRYGADGLPVRKSRAIYVKQAESLQIQTSLDRKEYRPGESAKLNVKLVDANGKPKPGAVSLSAVDEAVFSVLEQSPGTEQSFFTLEQEILKPVYAIYPWTPAAALRGSPAEQQRFEQALFSATAIRMSGDGRRREQVPHPPGSFMFPGPESSESVSPTSPGQQNRFSLNATTHDENVRRVAEWKEAGENTMKPLWIGFSIVCGFILLNQFWAVLAGRYNIWACLAITCGIAFFALVIPMNYSAQQLAERNAMFFGDAAQPKTAAAPRAAMAELAKSDSSAVISKLSAVVTLETASETTKSQPAVRVREWFPETLFWRPELITDDNGNASVDLSLADSITTWRMSASAVTAAGELGGSESSIRVYQPFFVDLNLPVSLTRGDEVSVPVVAYNYLDKPQTVKLSLLKQPWFELLEEADKSVELAAGEVRGLSFRLRVNRVGKHELQVNASAGDVADAIRREIEVVPDGKRIEQVVNGTLDQPQSVDLSIPSNAIEGSAKAIVKFYPTSFSQLVEGLDAVFRMPSGCFEQTSSTTYPNVLALDYLRRTGKSVPEVEAKARHYIHLGYQRLMTFEIDGGGFDWFGQGPANRALTAYGLMEFEDMARVHDVDPKLINRTRQWLLGQRQADGSWEPAVSHVFHEDPTRGNRDSARLSTTAYIAWALFSSGSDLDQAKSTVSYLQSQRPESIDDPYTLALVCNALPAMDSKSNKSTTRPWLDRLVALRKSSSDGKQVWWENSPNSRTTFYGAGQSGNVEATALATLALLKANSEHAATRGALTWLAAQKDAAGTWHSTQATVLALKALLDGTGKSLGGDLERRITLGVDENVRQEVLIPVDQADVVQQIDLSSHIAPGAHRLALSDASGQSTSFQATVSYHVPGSESAQPSQQPLTISIAYDRSSLSVNDTVTATAQVVNNMSETAPMVILDLPIPAGFELRVSDLDAQVSEGNIAKFQITSRSALLYLRALEPGKPLSLRHRLQATMPVKITVPAAIAYEYYDPAKRATSTTSELTVVAGS